MYMYILLPLSFSLYIFSFSKNKNVIMLNVIVFIRYLMLLNYIKAHTHYTRLLNCIENFTYVIVEILMQEVICLLNTTLFLSLFLFLPLPNKLLHRKIAWLRSYLVKIFEKP